MHLSGESLLVILFVGLIAGWLAGKIVRGTGFGIIGDILIGIAGAFVASWLFPKLGFRLGVGLTREIIYSAIGAIILLLVVRLFARVAASDRIVALREKAARRGRPLPGGGFLGLAIYSTISTIRRVRGSTRTVRPLTTV